MPYLLIGIILAIHYFGDLIPPFYQSLLYGLSLTIKSGIVFFLPFVIFSLLFRTTAQLANKASGLILFVLAAICLSNFFSTLVSYSVGSLIYQFDLSLPIPVDEASLIPRGDFSFPKWIENNHALLLGIVLGWGLGRFVPGFATSISLKLEALTHKILRVILWMIPLFIAGFMVKMNQDQVISYILSNYTLIFSMTAVAVFSYITLVFWMANSFKIKKTILQMKNMLPAAIAGFGSMSSAAAMPLTLVAAEKNAKMPSIAKSIIPTTVNVHLIGDCFAIPIFAFAVLKTFGVSEPTFLNYLIFSAYFVLAKFSVAAIPGGGILVMLPILEAYLGFNGEMLSLITALYILFDPVITSANVLGNGGFALVLENFFRNFALSDSFDNVAQ